MRLLAVESATSNLSVALLECEVVVAQTDEEAEHAHGRLLLPAIDRLLTQRGWTLSDLNGLAVSIGPGSFTGLRVGLATVLGFRSVLGLPLAAVPTLEAMAWNLKSQDPPLVPLVRARTGEVYWAMYRWTSAGVLTRVLDERVGPVEQVLKAIHGPTTVFGEGWEAYRTTSQAYRAAREHEVVEAPVQARCTSAASVGRAGLRMLERGEVAPIGIAPRYVQRTEAEALWERRVTGTTAGCASPRADDRSRSQH